jgi:hypothetical protein
MCTQFGPTNPLIAATIKLSGQTGTPAANLARAAKPVRTAATPLAERIQANGSVDATVRWQG